MLPGDDVIYSCPHCQATHGVATLMSGNNFGARFWSDGKMEAPMLPQQSSMIVCRSCQHLFFISDDLIIKDEEQTEKGSDHQLWIGEGNPDIQYIINMDRPLSDFSDDEKTEVCFHSWWLFNDRSRCGEKKIRSIAEKDWLQRCIEHLIVYVKENLHTEEENIFLLAELYRHCGQFEKSMQLLHGFEDRNDPLKHEMLKHNLKNDTNVFEITNLER